MINQESKSREILRLNQGINDLDQPTGFILEIVAYSDNPEIVISKIKYLMIEILNNIDNYEENDSIWMDILPDWFVNQFTVDHNSDEWHCGQFLSCMKSDSREWEWWNASIIKDNEFVIRISCNDIPFANEHLRIMLKYCGANLKNEYLY